MDPTYIGGVRGVDTAVIRDLNLFIFIYIHIIRNSLLFLVVLIFVIHQFHLSDVLVWLQLLSN